MSQSITQWVWERVTYRGPGHEDGMILYMFQIPSVGTEELCPGDCYQGGVVPLGAKSKNLIPGLHEWFPQAKVV